MLGKNYQTKKVKKYDIICSMVKILLWKKRIEKGFSLRKLAKLSGLSKTTINDIENGKHSPTVDELYMLSIPLECRIEDLYTY
jgi:transcriptional regulator with XRE-family HTH domain